MKFPFNLCFSPAQTWAREEKAICQTINNLSTLTCDSRERVSRSAQRKGRSVASPISLNVILCDYFDIAIGQEVVCCLELWGKSSFHIFHTKKLYTSSNNYGNISRQWRPWAAHNRVKSLFLMSTWYRAREEERRNLFKIRKTTIFSSPLCLPARCCCCAPMCDECDVSERDSKVSNYYRTHLVMFL